MHVIQNIQEHRIFRAFYLNTHLKNLQKPKICRIPIHTSISDKTKKILLNKNMPSILVYLKAYSSVFSHIRYTYIYSFYLLPVKIPVANCFLLKTL